MNYTGRQVLVSVREREDGAWRFAVWMRDERGASEEVVPYQEAWKDVPLQFDDPGWLVEGIISNVLRYVKHVNENRTPEQVEELDLWGDV